MNEIILTACVLRNNWEPIYCKRHWDGIFVKKNIYNENTTQEQQWFWTTKSRFIDRKEAYQLAHKNWQLNVISKRFWFIEWLVDQNKIEFDRARDRSDFPLLYAGWWEFYSDSEVIIATLSVEDNPIEFLVSILK